MEIAVDGWRAGVADWDAVRNLPAEKLPALTKEEREVAKKLGVPEAEYARSALAGEHSYQIRVGNEAIPLRIAEQVVDDLFEAGSSEAEQRLGRILSTALVGRIRAQ